MKRWGSLLTLDHGQARRRVPALSTHCTRRHSGFFPINAGQRRPVPSAKGRTELLDRIPNFPRKWVERNDQGSWMAPRPTGGRESEISEASMIRLCDQKKKKPRRDPAGRAESCNSAHAICSPPWSCTPSRETYQRPIELRQAWLICTRPRGDRQRTEQSLKGLFISSTSLSSYHITLVGVPPADFYPGLHPLSLQLD
jgi:hypothetical protein